MKTTRIPLGPPLPAPEVKRNAPLPYPPVFRTAAAPPVYRPHAQTPQPKLDAHARPDFPPVYRPQGPVQPKANLPNPLSAGVAAPVRMQAPPVYRPQHAIAPQMSSFSNGNQNAAPPVYRAPQRTNQAPPRYVPTIAPIQSKPALRKDTFIPSPQIYLRSVLRKSNSIQRMVPSNLPMGTEVVVVRSTSTEFHGERAFIRGSGERSNEYLIEVSTREHVYARTDQLRLPSDISRLPEPIQADLSAMDGKSADEIILMVRSLVQSEINPTRPFLIGGSFAAFLHARRVSQSARTPRDIDIVLHPDDFGGGSKPKQTRIKFCGIPLELHRSGSLIKPSEEDQKIGIVGPQTLLEGHKKKLRDQHRMFKGVLAKELPAKNLMAAMLAGNTDIMGLRDSEPDEYGRATNIDYIDDTNKTIWAKALVDVEVLSHLGHM